MARKLTDLPPEVVQRIIHHCFLYPWLGSDLPDGFEHVGIGPDARRRQPYCSTPTKPPADVTWPEGLPSNPLVPLSLVSRTFRQCAQERLFSHVGLYDPCEAYLFLQVLTCPPELPHESVMTPSATMAKPNNAQEGGLEIAQSSDNDHPGLHKLARQVLSIQFEWTGPSSMGKGGGSLICDILRCCPLLENVAIKTSFFDRCEKPILEALKSRPLIKKYIIFPNSRCARRRALLSQEAVTQLFTQWDLLETAKLCNISGRPIEMIETVFEPIPILSCTVKMIELADPDLDQRELSCLLKSSIESMQMLRIIRPSSKLDRKGLCQILTECTGPNLEYLGVHVTSLWYPIRSCENVEGSEDPAKNRGLMDIVFKSSPTALRRIKSLILAGNLVGSDFISLLPQSIVTLDLSKCRISASAFLHTLSSYRGIDHVKLPDGRTCSQSHSSLKESVQWLPNLKSCAIPDDDKWPSKTRKQIETILKARGVSYHGCYGWSAPHRENEDEGKVTDWSDSVSDDTLLPSPQSDSWQH